MATKQTNGKESAKEETMALPAGFRRRSSVTDAPWVAQEKGNVCRGHLLNRYPMNGMEPARYYYQIELTAPCKVRVGRGDDAEIQQAEAGEVVNLNENHKTSCLRDVEIPEVIAGAAYDVIVQFGDKMKIGGGKTMWKIDVSTKQLKAPTSQVRPLVDVGASASGEGEEAPF